MEQRITSYKCSFTNLPEAKTWLSVTMRSQQPTLQKYLMCYRIHNLVLSLGKEIKFVLCTCSCYYSAFSLGEITANWLRLFSLQWFIYLFSFFFLCLQAISCTLGLFDRLLSQAQLQLFLKSVNP